MKIIRRKETAVGFLVLFAIFASFGGGNGIVVLIGSIICTAGIALVIWGPLAFLIGAVIFKLIDLLGKKEEVAEVESQKPVLTKEQQAIVNYIDRAIESGLSYERITSALKAQGWTEDEIKEAFNSYKSAGP